MVKVYTEMPYGVWREGQRNQLICLLGFALYVIIMLSVIYFEFISITWLFGNIWFLIIPLIPVAIIVGLTIRWANKRFR